MSVRNLFSAVLCSMAAVVAGPASAELLITEVVDATLSGGNPKYVEITNTGATDFTFTGGGIINQSNANTDLDIDTDLTGVTILAGQSYVIQSSSNGGQAIFESTYGFAADLYTTAFFSNGDDRYILADADDGAGVATNIVDIHGQIDTDGTGQPWEYLDSYAARLLGPANGGTFDISQWFHAGVNALETGDDVTEAALIVANTTPGSWSPIPEPASIVLMMAALVGLGATRRK